MKITQKFLLFGLIPAVMQVGFLVQLFSLLRTEEVYAQEEAKQSLIARTLVTAVAQVVDIAVVSGVYAARPSDDLKERALQSTDRVTKTFTELRDLTRDDPVTHDEITQLMELGINSRKDFFSYKGFSDNLSPSTEQSSDDRYLQQFKFGQRSLMRTRQIGKILERQGERLKDIRKKQKENRAAVQNLVLIELILGLVLIAVVYLVFRVDFVRRFNDLLQIARDLALDKDTKTIPGKDELSELSHALVEAAEARREAVAQKELLFQMVAHDIRSPLMAASIVVETLLADKNPTEEKTENRLVKLQRSLTRVIGLANDLLTIERLRAGRLELTKDKVDLRKTIDLALETVQPIADQKKLALVNQAEQLQVSIDEERMLQVLINLLSNAIKFSPNGAPVVVTATTSGRSIEVEVLDRGPGISKKDIDRLFNPFQQGSDDYKSGGFGLGLALAKMLIELHGGDISASPRRDGGTSFFFTIPI